MMRKLSPKRKILFFTIVSVAVVSIILSIKEESNSSVFISDAHKICISGSIISGNTYETTMKECAAYLDMRCAALGYLPTSLIKLRTASLRPGDTIDYRCVEFGRQEIVRIGETFSSSN